MGRKWKLPAEFTSVAGCHHDWSDNRHHTRSAALANLAYRLDLAYSTRDPELLARVGALPSLVFLAPQPEARARLLEVAEAAYSPASSAAPSGEGSSPSVGSGGAFPVS